MHSLLLVLLGLLVWIQMTVVDCFSSLPPRRIRPGSTLSIVWLEAAGGKKKKRRRRKKPPATAVDYGAEKVPVAEEKASRTVMVKEIAAPAPIEKASAQPEAEEEVAEAREDARIETSSKDEKKMEKSVIANVASFQFESDDAIITKGIQSESSGGDTSDDPLFLPDIKDMLKKKEIEQEKERIEKEKREGVKKIKRSDKEAFRKLLESQPYADADDSFFEKEEYGTVSALLGENAKSFLGIPPGPLQVGHFIGALVIFLMAFVEYPGFPLTNLPTPVRECFQGGLASIYLVNIILAVLATFKAEERGQSKVLWGVKTFSVGGLAYDQLTQLPTLVEVEEAQSRKGKRAANKR